MIRNYRNIPSEGDFNLKTAIETVARMNKVLKSPFLGLSVPPHAGVAAVGAADWHKTTVVLRFNDSLWSKNIIGLTDFTPRPLVREEQGEGGPGLSHQNVQ